MPRAYALGTTALARAVGQNIGNMAFRHGLRFIVAGLEGYERRHFRDLRDVADHGPVDHSILSCANWLGTGGPAEEACALRIRALRLIDGPLICFGLGVQSGDPDASAVPLGPHARRLAAILSERSRTVGVRDALTARVLADLGLHNTVVMGCPSNFIDADPALGARVAAAARAGADRAAPWARTRSMVSEFATGHAAATEVMRAQLNLLHASPAFYVVQTPVLMPFLLRENDALPPRYAAAAPAGLEAEGVAGILRAKTLHFTSVETWMDVARTCDLGFGMRIHGTVLPLQAGVPSLLIAHDSRTRGLARAMGIPDLPPERFLAVWAGGPAALFAHVAEIMEGYDARRRALAQIMLGFVTENGLSAHGDLIALAAAAPSVAQSAAPHPPQTQDDPPEGAGDPP